MARENTESLTFSVDLVKARGLFNKYNGLIVPRCLRELTKPELAQIIPTKKEKHILRRDSV